MDDDAGPPGWARSEVIMRWLALPVVVVLPNNSPETQLVRVQARNFTGMVPIRVSLIPDSGDAVIEDATINMTTNPAQIDLMMDFPANTAVSVEAFTR